MTNAIAHICSQDIIGWYCEKAPKRKIDVSLAETCAGFIEKVLGSYTKTKDSEVKSVRFEFKKIFTNDDNNTFFFQYATPDLIKKHALISIELTKYTPLNQKECVVIYLRKSILPSNSSEGSSNPTSTSTAKVSVVAPLTANSPEKPGRDALKICSQDILNWYSEKAPNRKIDPTLAETCAGVVEEVLGLYTKKDAKQIARLELKQIFVDVESNVFFFQFVIPKLIHDHTQINIVLKKHSPTNQNGCVIIYSRDGLSLIPKLEVSIHLPIDTTTKILDLATSVANEFYLKCLEKQEEKDSFSITIQSSTIFPGKTDEDVLKNCEFYLFTLPKILEKKGIIILDASTKLITTENYSFFTTTFHKSNIIPILKQLSDMFEHNAEEGFYAIIKRCRPIYEGESDEIILKNSEFYAVTLPKLLESKDIFLRDVVVQFLNTDNEYLIQYYRKTESLYYNNSTQKKLDFTKTPAVNVHEGSPYSKFIFTPSEFPPDKLELTGNKEVIDTTSHLSSSPPGKAKSFIASTIDMNNAKVRMFSRGSMRDLTSAYSKPNLEIKTHQIEGEENKLIIESKEKIPNKN